HLDNATIGADIDLTGGSSFLYVDNGLTLHGSAAIGGSASLYFLGSGEQLLDGSGTVELQGGSAALFNPTGSTLHLGSGLTVHGAGGSVGSNQTNAGLVNDAVIDSDGGGTIAIGATKAWTSSGSLIASAGNLVASGPWTNGGIVRVSPGRTLASATGYTQSAA